MACAHSHPHQVCPSPTHLLLSSRKLPCQAIQPPLQRCIALPPSCAWWAGDAAAACTAARAARAQVLAALTPAAGGCRRSIGCPQLLPQLLHLLAQLRLGLLRGGQLLAQAKHI